MKKFIFLFTLFAFFTLTTTAVSAQSTNFVNKSECTVTVQLLALDANCDIFCATTGTTVAGESEVDIAWPCGMIVVPFGASMVVRVLDGTTPSAVGTGCGFGTTDNYDDCNSVNRTLELYSHISVAIY